MKTVLSTKILTVAQKELLLNAKMGLVEYNAIQIDFPSVEIPVNFKNYIFTSKNGAKAFIKVLDSHKTKIERKNYICFCVGDKTKKLLEDSGFLVAEIASSASELGAILVEKFKTNRFVYISGNLRRNELPEILLKNNIWFQEIVAYHTNFTPRRFESSFNGILFFSPSGIQSHFEANSSQNAPCFCIGKTTAKEAEKHFDQIIIAKRPTTENVLVQVIKYFKTND